MSGARILVAFERLPEYDGDAAKQIATTGSDVREAAQRVDKRLREQASTLSATGWVVDEEYAADTDHRFEKPDGARMIVGKLRITRGDA